MSDRLYLSMWLENHSALGMHRKFQTALARFPFSTQAPQVYLRVSAVDSAEPALLEQVYQLPQQQEELFADLEKWRSADVSFEVEGFWDLWMELPEGWRLKPNRINLHFYGPEYPSEPGEAIRIELGIESLLLPSIEQDPGTLHYFQSNIKSLLRLGAEWGSALALKDRKLWSEAGGNLSERLQWLAASGSTHAN